MAYTLAVDAIDGTLARAVRVKEVIPWVDGSRLDDVVDYFTYVLVPASSCCRWTCCRRAGQSRSSLVAIASGYGFSQTTAKTADHFFTGFPSYWNIVAFYLYALGWSPAVNAPGWSPSPIGVFVPIRYVYPSRTTDAARPHRRPSASSGASS